MYKKLIAGFMAVLMTLVTTVTPVLSATALKDIPGALGVLGTNAYIVVGATAKTEDVVGAVDIAARLAEQSYREVSVTGVSDTGVTGGVKLDTKKAQLNLGSDLGDGKGTITSLELPDFLADGTVVDTEGKEYKYKHYIRFTNADAKIEFDKPEEEDPVFLVKGEGNTLFELEVVFDEAFDAKKAIGESITLFGREYTIGSGTDANKLELYTSASELTLNIGESETVTLGGKTYTVRFTGIVEEGTKYLARITVGTSSGKVEEGKSYTIGGLEIFAKEVTYMKLPEQGTVVLLVGSERTVFEDGQAVSINDESVDGTTVDLTGNVSALTNILVKFDGTSENPEKGVITEGSTYTDPVFGKVKLSFYGRYPQATEEVSFAPVGDKAYRITFEDAKNDRITLTWAYIDVATLRLGDKDGKIVTGENTNMIRNEYTILACGEYSRIVKYMSHTTDKVTIRDIIAGKSWDVEVKSGQNKNIVIDGETYTITRTDNTIRIDQPCNPTALEIETKTGAKISFNPTPVSVKIETAEGAEITVEAEKDTNNKIDLGTVSGDISAFITLESDDDKQKAVTDDGGIVTTDSNANTIKIELLEEKATFGVAVGPNPVWGETTTTEGTVKQMVPIMAAVGKLDTDPDIATLKATKNLILVGGPCVNALVAELNRAGKFPYGCADWPGRDFGLVEVIDNGFASGRTVLIVAGTRAQDTRLAATVLQQWDTWLKDKIGTAVETTGLTAATIIPVRR